MTQLIDECKVMALMNDMLVQSMIIRDITQSKPSRHNTKYIRRVAEAKPTRRRILELGSGAGGWTKIMHKLSEEYGNPPLDVGWILVENFMWMNESWTETKQGSNWPTTKEELREDVKDMIPHAILENIYDHSVSQLISDKEFNNCYNNNISFMRIDVSATFQEIEHFIHHNLDDDAMIIIDDTRMNCGVERIYLLFELLRNNLGYPVWLGEKESMLCKNPDKAKFYSNWLAEALKEKNYNIYWNQELKVFFGIDCYFTTTTPFNVFAVKAKE